MLFRVNRVEEKKRSCKVELRKTGVLTGSYSPKIYVKAGDTVEARVNGTCTEGRVFWSVTGGEPSTPKGDNPTITFSVPGQGEVNAGIGELGEFSCEKATVVVQQLPLQVQWR